MRWAVELEPLEPEGSAAPRDDADAGLPHGRARARVRAETLGVSLGGTYVVSDDPFPVDTDLQLWLYPSTPPSRGPRALRLLGRVRWINPTPGVMPRGFGVAFRALTTTEALVLHASFSHDAKGARRRSR